MPDESPNGNGNGADDLKTYVFNPDEWGASGTNPVAEKTPPQPHQTHQTHPSHQTEPFAPLTPPSAVTPGSGSAFRTPSGGPTSDYDIPFRVTPAGVQINKGDTLFDIYVVQAKLGEGGMGSVWQVLNEDLQSQRALKLILDANFTEDARARLRREAHLMALLKHENAVQVYASKVRPSFAYIEMELLKGKSIDRMLDRGRPRELGWIARILDQLCSVLEYAHERVCDQNGRPIKIVHRDLKPSNLMILDDESNGPLPLKVLDFGIAKKVELQQPEGDNGDYRTGTGGALFTLPYASPEQIGGQRDISEKSDVYSVGVMLYEFLTGYRPFEEPGLVYKQISAPPPPFRDRNPSVRPLPEIEALVMRCLSKNPAERPSARQLADQFLAALPPDLVVPTKPLSRSSGYTQVPGGGSRTIPPGTGGYQRPQYEPEPTQRDTGPGGTLEKTEVGQNTRPTWSDPTQKYKSRKTAAPTKKSGSMVGLIIVGIIALSSILLVGLFLVVGGGGTENKPGKIPDPPPPIPPPAPIITSLIPPGYEEVPNSRAKVGDYPQVIQRKGTDIRFVYIAARSFRMGMDRDHDLFKERIKGIDETKPRPPFEKDDLFDDLPQHTVMVSHFYLQETEVTNGEIASYMSKRSVAERDRWERDYQGNQRAMRDKPAVKITKEIAQDYAKSVGGSLPSELQWEFAARSGDPRFRPFVWRRDNVVPGHVRDDLNIEVAQAQGQPIDAIRSVNQSKEDKTDDGVFGLMGNVREWCLDDWAPYPTEDANNKLLPKRDPVNLTPFGKRQSVVRGGSYRTSSDRCLTTWPRRLMPNFDDETIAQVNESGSADDIGFRVVLPLPEIKGN